MFTSILKPGYVLFAILTLLAGSAQARPHCCSPDTELPPHCFEYVEKLNIAYLIGYESEAVAEGSKYLQQNYQAETYLSHPLLGGDIALDIWAITPINSPALSNQTEINYALEYSYNFKNKYTLTAGFNYVHFPNVSGSGSQSRERELYVGYEMAYGSFEHRLLYSYNC